MKKACLVLATLIVLSFLLGQTYEPIPSILNMLTLLNPDTLQAHVQHLQDYQTRHAMAGNQLQIATWLADQFESYGYSDTHFHEFPLQNTTQYNVIATIPGYQYPERLILVSAHYDSQSLNSSNFVWAPGADDNASGTAALLEMARVMKATSYQSRYSIVFIAFAAEEGPGAGSQAYCDWAHSQNLDIRMMVNMDMIGSNHPTGNQFRVVPFTGFLTEGTESILFSEPYSALEPVAGEVNLGGDGYIFAQEGYPAVMFIENTLSPYWHTGEDTIDHLDFQYALQMLKAATATTAIYANLPPAPQQLSVFDSGSGSCLHLQWDSSNDPEVDHYAVFYGTYPDSLASLQYVNNTQCLLSGLVEGQMYHIGVAAIKQDGYPSQRIFVSEMPLSIPRVPQRVRDNPSTNSITISWSPNSELDLVGYSIYRRLGLQGSFTLIGSVSAADTFFIDTEVSSNLEYYYYRVCALDSQGLQSHFSEALSSRLVSLDRGILVIDESKDFGGSSPFLPTDQAVDDFYADLLDGYAQVQELDLEDYVGTLRLADIGVYSSILWHGNDNSDYVYPYQLQDLIRQYINLGGQILFSVYFPSKAFELNAGYPAVFPPDSFIHEVLGISGVNYRSSARFKYAVSNQANYPSLQVDSLKTINSMQGHIVGVETLESVDPSESIYLYDSDYTSDSSQGYLNGETVGLRHHYGAGQAICLSFPLYNMQYHTSEVLAEYVFSSIFNESSEEPGYTLPPISGLILHPNHPNPFKSETLFRVQCPIPGNSLTVAIFNLRGQLVQTIYQGYPNKSDLYVWNGKDKHGKEVGSGIYFIRVETANQKIMRKVLKVH